MSLINDALKRAKHAPKKPAPPVSDALCPRPVEPARPLSGSGRIFAPMLWVAALAVSAPLVWVATRFANRPAPVHIAAAPAPTSIQANVTERAPGPPQPTVAREQPVSAPTPSPQPAMATRSSAPPPGAPAAMANPPVAVRAGLPASDAGAPTLQAAEPTPAAEPASPPAPTALPKLQGIFYRTQRPAALVNGKMVLVGGMVGEHRVAAISPRSVTLVRAGATNVLALE